MTEREALKLALDYIVATNKSSEFWLIPASNLNKTVTAIKEALAQPEQEPVAWSYWQSCLNDDGTQTAPWVHRLSKFKPNESIINKDIVPLYTTPPQRTWVGLTDEDKQNAFDDTQEGGSFWEFADAIEAKLKEKNT